MTGSPILCQNDADLNFDWAYGSPGPLIPDDGFSARWTQTFDFTNSGIYRFYVWHDDGVRLYIDNVLKLGVWNTCCVSDTVDVSIQAGPHTIRVEYFEGAGAASAQVSWEQISEPPATFADVPFSHPYFNAIEVLYANGYTGGCATSPSLLFCPDTVMDRAQSAVFMLRGNFGSSYLPVTPTHFFKDNWASALWAEGWAESMYLEGLTGGCALSPLKFCPSDQLTNVQAAVFGVRLKHGMSFIPPAPSGTVFADMTDVNFWGLSWAEQAFADGLIPSCGTGTGGKPLFCPNALVSRGFGASIIVKAKNLVMP